MEPRSLLAERFSSGTFRVGRSLSSTPHRAGVGGVEAVLVPGRNSFPSIEAATGWSIVGRIAWGQVADRVSARSVLQPLAVLPTIGPTQDERNLA